MTSIAALFVLGAAGALAILLLRRPKGPKARFFADGKISIEWGFITVRCRYWVDWNTDRWHVDVENIEDRSGGPSRGDVYVSKMIAYALRGRQRREIWIGGVLVIPDRTWPELPQIYA